MSERENELRSLSLTQSGRGVGLRNRTVLTQLGTPISLGKSPGAGTSCTLELGTNFDTAYDNAVISWFVTQLGHIALMGTTTIDPAYNAANTALVYTQAGFACDFWSITIQLAGGTLPAAPLYSSLIANGVENAGQASGAAASLFFSESFTGPSQAGSALFTVPDGLSTYLVTLQMYVTSGAHAGDAASTEAVYAWKSVAGVVSLVPGVLTAPSTSYDAFMSTGATPTPGSSGAQAEVSFTTPSGLGAGEVVLVTVSLTPVGED
jgi:hypothetical protein